MIAVVATLKTLDGKGDDFAAAARQMIAAVAQHEAGRTLMYTLHRSQADPNTFVFYEQYADAEALAAHGQTEHMRAFGGAIRGLLDGRPDIQRFDLVAQL